MTPRFFMGLALASSLLAGFGCAPKVIRVYAPAPAPALRSDIVSYAETLLGRPYRNGAKGPYAFDCSGFVHYVFAKFDIGLPVSTEGLVKRGYEIPRSDVATGDLVLFRIKRDLHVGIMINAEEFIHASKSRGVVIDDVDARYWRRSFSHFRRVF